MTMTTADVATDDGVMGPRADRSKRRSFTAEYRRQILAEYDAAARGERGAILRREGLYSSHLIEWRKAARVDARAGLGPRSLDRRDEEIEQLRCSMSTMHQILHAHDLAGERRRQATHPSRKKPELLATRPGQVWSWDIRKLRGPTRGVYYDLYLLIDIYSRYVVAWTVAGQEDSQIAKAMLEEAIGRRGSPSPRVSPRSTRMAARRRRCPS